MEKAVSLHPATVVVVLTVGGAAFGVLGIILAVPAVVVATILVGVTLWKPCSGSASGARKRCLVCNLLLRSVHTVATDRHTSLHVCTVPGWTRTTPWRGLLSRRPDGHGGPEGALDDQLIAGSYTCPLAT